MLSAGPSLLHSGVIADLLTGTAFEMLFQLLSLDDDVGRVVWNIVQLLPTNALKLKTIRSMDGATGPINWDCVLDNKGAFPLLYSLQIMDTLLHGVSGAAVSSAGGDRNKHSRTAAQDGKRVQWIKV